MSEWLCLTVFWGNVCPCEDVIIIPMIFVAEYDKSVKSTTTSSLTPTNTTPVSQWDNIVLIGSVTGAIVVIAIVIAVATVCIYRSRHPPPVIKAEQPPPYTRYSVSNGATVHTEGNTPEEKSPDITAHPGPPAIPSAPPEEH